MKATADSKAAARRLVRKAVDESLRRDGGAGFAASSPFSAGVDGWLADIEGLVARGARSPSTLDQYQDTVRRHVRPALGESRSGAEHTEGGSVPPGHPR